MRLLRRLRDTSLLTRFGVISLVLTVAVGVLLSSVLSRSIAERAREHAEWTVIVTVRPGQRGGRVIVPVRLGLRPELTPADLVRGFAPGRLAGVEKAVPSAARNLQ